jgi:hypothetical protein
MIGKKIVISKLPLLTGSIPDCHHIDRQWQFSCSPILLAILLPLWKRRENIEIEDIPAIPAPSVVARISFPFNRQKTIAAETIG